MKSLPSKVKHSELEDAEVMGGCDVQVDCNATPYIKVWVWLRSAVLRAAPGVVAAKPWWQQSRGGPACTSPPKIPPAEAIAAVAIYSPPFCGVSPCCCGDQIAPASYHGHIQTRSQKHWKSPRRAPTPGWDTEALSIPPSADAELKIAEDLVSQMKSRNGSSALCSGHP